MAESPQNLYARNLQQSFGYPLRSPEPKLGLPSSYAESGLHIGDVGYVNPHGVFEVLFNICLSPDHDLHRRKNLAKSLVGLVNFDANEVPPFPDAIPAGRAICHGMEGDQGNNLKPNEGTPCIFKSRSTSGAILILPSGAIRQDLDESLEEEFRKLAEERAPGWCEFAKRKSLYLITGFHKTRSWLLASFHDVKPGEVLLERVKDGCYTWKTSCDYRQSPEGNLKENQTIFISGFKIEVRDWDRRILVEKLSSHQSVWFKMTSWARFLLDLLLFFLRRIFSGVHIKHVPALSQPFHPSDIINRYLLDKNRNAQVAITHDGKWLSMIEKNELSLEDMMVDGRLGAFLEENYTDDLSSDNVVCVRRKIDEPNNEEVNGRYKSTLSRKMFSVSTDDIRQFVIARLRAENIVTCLRRMPIGFYVIIQFNGTKRRSDCKSVSFRDSVVEWDNEIMLPTDPTVKVQFSIIASFEFEPMLGNGEMLCMLETSVGKLTEGVGSTCLLSSSRGGEDTSCSPSLLITLKERWLDSYSGFGLDLECEDGSSIEAEVTDKGHKALLCYHRGDGKEKLLESVGCFKLTLSLCPRDHRCHAAALSNHATASFINAQAHGTISDLYVAIDSYRKALVLRPGCHPDRPRTLLHLAQALLVQYGKLRYEAPIADEIEGLVTEIKTICSKGRYEHRAAHLVAQTLKRYRALASGTLAELSEWVSEVDQHARLPPDGHFDWPYQSMDLSIALRKRFEITGYLEDLRKSISVAEETLQLVPDGHFDKPRILASLGDALCERFIQCGDVVDLTNSISMIESAVKLAADGHFDRPWMLASLGCVLRARFVQRGDVADLDSSISVFEDAMKLTPDVHFDKVWILASQGDALRARFEQRGDVTDLDNSVVMIKDAVELAPDDHFCKPRMLTSLGDVLRVRFVQYGNITDLDNSIVVLNNAVKLTSDGHFNKPWMLTSLGGALRVRFAQRGEVADLDNSISVFKDAVKNSPDAHFDKAWMLASLGDALCARFVQRGDITDLDKSIAMIKDAVELAPDGRFGRPWMLLALGDALRAHFVQHRDVTNLDKSIAIIKGAVELAPDGYFDTPWMLVSLGDALRARFVQCSDVADLDKSISVFERAVKLAPDGHFGKPRMIACLGDALRMRFVWRGDIVDLDNSICMVEEAVKLTQDES